ncbi:hypothetical protein MVEN_02130700 [Mycena venus]|uniref:F-box domain-containing protein n=1 Tax=Mycena venus TaxID=2733690 RepID=A0A8H7CIT0_9AGAR|nr:hypothetical protein MVEN_02130700 [Mycena venus]
MSTSIVTTDALANLANACLRLGELNDLTDAPVAERQKIQDKLDSIVYSVLTIPPEITAHIFIQCLPKEIRPSRHIAPLLLTQICHDWRMIALATPSLWDSITLTYDARKDPERLLEMWLQRSASLPLYLFLGAPDAALTRSLLDASLIHHCRWRELKLSSHADMDAGSREFPILNKITFADPSRGPRVLKIRNAPALDEVSITMANSGAFDVELPWSQLKTIRLKTFTDAWDCLQMLNQCSDLLLLAHRAIVWQNVIETFSHPHITLSNLESLEVEYKGSSIVPHLTLPRLRYLTLSGRIASAIEPFRALLSRSSCSLQYLSIVITKYDNTKPYALYQIFQLVPTVTTLVLDLEGRRRPLHRIIEALSSADVLPTMHTLIIAAERRVDDYDYLLNILRLRCENGTLRTFTLTFHPSGSASGPTPPFPELAMAHFCDLANSGLKICICLNENPWSVVLLDTLE